MNKRFLGILLLSTVLLSCRNTPTPQEIVEDIKNREIFETYKTISFSDTTQNAFSQITVLDKAFRATIVAETQNFYKQYGYQTRWLYEKQASDLFFEYIKVLKKTEDYGLNPETYRYKTLQQSVDSLYKKTPSLPQIEHLDKEITASFLLLTKHLESGRIVKLTHGKHIWRRHKKNREDLEILLKIREDEKLSDIVQALHPQHPLYRRMSEKYKSLKNISDTDSMPSVVIEQPKLFVKGFKNQSVVYLRAHLKRQGFEAIPESADNVVDSTLLRTLMDFQQKKGLNPDGVPGKSTLYHLNMTVSQQRDLLQLNLERLRWLNNSDLGDNYIVVNIPDFKLFVYEKDSIISEMNVIVGAEYTATPVFIDTLKYVEFRPTWTVPQSIIRNEMIPQIVAEENPEKYAKRGYTLYEDGKQINPTDVDWNDPNINKRKFRFVEAPSSRNSLGLVKFILTNDMSIYLHDTPSPKLFEREYRALSHGCVRVEKPADLAYLLLRNQDEEWTKESVIEAMNNTQRNQRRITLKTKYLVNILYLTAWVDENNNLVIKNDIYGFDQEQLKELKKYQ